MTRWTSPNSRLSDDFILTNILLYWFSGSITSSFWLYYNVRRFTRSTSG
jgi:hypothetical protein